jgi:uncharacterized membrane protein
MNPDTQFSKERIEMLCDGVFAIAMTLLVLELKVPDLPKGTPSVEIWRALRGHGLSFFAFALTFLLAGQFWLIHHIFFHYLRHATRAIAVLSLVFLMFVSLLPFSASMFVAYGTRQSAGMVFYFGNQLVLASLMAVQWLVARAQGLLTGADTDPKRRSYFAVLRAMPVVFALLLIVAVINPAWLAWATWPLAATMFLIRKLARKRAALPS